MDDIIDPYPRIHISSIPTTFYGCPCGITIPVYSVSPIVSENNNFHPQILTESLRFYRPLPYPYTWYVYGEEAAVVNMIDLQAYQQTHQYPPSYVSYQDQEEEDIIYIDEIGGEYYSHESVDDVAILTDFRMDDDDEVIMNESFQQQASEASSGLTKKEISKKLKVMKYDDEEESEVCVVCQDEFEKKERVGVLQCKHRFHPECIKEWLLRNNVCPLCKNQALNV